MDGVGITDFSTDNLVEGNYIGTDYLGTEALGNIQGGISIGDAATNNTVGGITPGARNLISGNYGDGVSIIEVAGANTTDNLVEGNYYPGTEEAQYEPDAPARDSPQEPSPALGS